MTVSKKIRQYISTDIQKQPLFAFIEDANYHTKTQTAIISTLPCLFYSLSYNIDETKPTSEDHCRNLSTGRRHNANLSMFYPFQDCLRQHQCTHNQKPNQTSTGRYVPHYN